MDIKEQIRKFVEGNFYVGDAPLEDDTSLIRQGIVDSTGILEVIDFIENGLGVEVTDRDAVPANLESIARIAAFVARKREGAAREGT